MATSGIVRFSTQRDLYSRLRCHNSRHDVSLGVNGQCINQTQLLWITDHHSSISYADENKFSIYAVYHHIKRRSPPGS